MLGGMKEADGIILEKSMCDNRICHGHVEPRAHKESSLIYLRRGQMADIFPRNVFAEGNEAPADICLTPENPGRSALLRTIGRFSNDPIE